MIDTPGQGDRQPAGDGGPADVPYNPELAALHRLVLVPFIGAIVVLGARSRAATESDRSELTAAWRCQLLGAAIWALHMTLQAAIFGIGWLVDSSHHQPLVEPARWILLIASVANIATWLVEWAIPVRAGLRAAGGNPYPLTRAQRRRQASAEGGESSAWRSLNDG